MSPDATAAHHALIDQLIARGSLWSRPLVAAFRDTPRHLFVDHVYRSGGSGWELVRTDPPDAEGLRLVYSDRALTTHLGGAGPGHPAVPTSSSSQPSLMSQMLEDLQLEPGLAVLEIGAGTGYNAALIAHVVGAVTSVDVDREVLAAAARHLTALPDRAVTLAHGDGREGWPADAPYDRILLTVAAEDLEPAWIAQCREGGLIQAPLDLAPGVSSLVQGEVRGGMFVGRLTRPAYFVPLRDEGSPGREQGRPGGEAGAVPGPERMEVVAAPWWAWVEQRRATRDVGLAVTFLGWLEGLSLAAAALPDGRQGHGVADLITGNVCWLGARDWYVSGKGGRALADRLWRTWLDLGGPAPGEWRLTAVPGWDERPAATEAVGFVRQGLRCRQRWELIEPRVRPEPA